MGCMKTKIKYIPVKWTYRKSRDRYELTMQRSNWRSWMLLATVYRIGMSRLRFFGYNKSNIYSHKRTKLFDTVEEAMAAVEKNLGIKG